MTDQRGRPRGSHNVKPTGKQISGYYRMLRSAADAGDVNAARHLLELRMIEQKGSSNE